MRRLLDAVGWLTTATIRERTADDRGVDAGPVSPPEPSLVRHRGCNGISSTLHQSVRWGVVHVSEHWNSGGPNTTDGRTRVRGCRRRIGEVTERRVIASLSAAVILQNYIRKTLGSVR